MARGRPSGLDIEYRVGQLRHRALCGRIKAPARAIALFNRGLVLQVGLGRNPRSQYLASWPARRAGNLQAEFNEFLYAVGYGPRQVVTGDRGRHLQDCDKNAGRRRKRRRSGNGPVNLEGKASDSTTLIGKNLSPGRFTNWEEWGWLIEAFRQGHGIA